MALPVDPEELADFVADRARQDPRVRQVVADVQMFDGLRDHVGWRRLYEKVKADRKRFLAGIARRLMAGEKVSQAEIDFHRGFYFGAEWVLGIPEMAEESLERAARQAWVMAELELNKEEEASPYA